jgi:tRNA pseudouridine55 synthase
MDSEKGAGGLLLVDKPTGVTSHDVVAAIRKLVRPLKVGHTGTLDPLASGLLILCVGEATKIAGFIESSDKLYRAGALFGVRTDTQDVEGEIIAEQPVENLSDKKVREAARSFVGKIKQTPPAYSAIKVDGVRAYKRARRGEKFQIEPRTVEIKRLEIESVQPPRISFLVECSKGAYIRALCSDLGDALGVGGCLESLRRLAIGRFEAAAAKPPAGLDTRDKIVETLLPASQALSHLPAIKCAAEEAVSLSHGRALSVGEREFGEHEGAWAQAFGPDGKLLAVGKLALEGGETLFHPKKVFAATRERPPE